MQGPSQPGTAPQQSALLHCLSQLNSDAWAQVLLPKLVEQGSAKNVALACSQLRELCFSSKQSISLGDLLETADLSQLGSEMQGLPTHFPNCAAVSVELCSSSSYHAMPYLLPALARLRQLDTLSLTVSETTQPLQATTMLHSMRMQLPGLHTLGFQIEDTDGWFKATDMLAELGRFSQLTQLGLYLHNTQELAVEACAGVQQLSGLTQLEHLLLWITDHSEADRAMRYYAHEEWPALPELLSNLTALTRFESNLFNVQPLASVSSCVGLRHLSICLGADSWELGPVEWSCLAQLSCLTHLKLLNAKLREANSKTCSALSKLTKLQLIAAATWCPAFGVALVGCAQLTEVCGEWEVGGEVAGLTLPQVLVLSGAGRWPPARYFPSLQHYRANIYADGLLHIDLDTVSPSSLQSLCTHCTSLREPVLKALLAWGAGVCYQQAVSGWFPSSP